MICGHGVLNEHLRQLVTELQLDDSVTFLGYREDMLEVYPCADLFLFPSFQEGLPMALLEAMASGLPVVCSYIRGSRDLMEPDDPAKADTASLLHCKGGIMTAKADDVTAYSAALRAMLNTPESLPSMGEANRVRAEQFSSQEVTARMNAIYQRIASL